MMIKSCPACGEDNLLRLDIIYDNRNKDTRQASITCLKCGYTVKGKKMSSICLLEEAKVSAIVSWNITAYDR
jgi:predicted nucleic-acid-binding Zn-ribbon protein